MEPEEVKDWIKRSPVLVRMNNGDTYEVPGPEFALVGDYSMAVLTRDKGRLLNKLIALMNISEITALSRTPDQSK